MTILEKIDDPSNLKNLGIKELEQLAQECREKIVGTCSTTGGHVAPSLGTIELTIALHYCLNSPTDKILWDVSHQCYTHKILTGRKDKFNTLRCYKGLSGFTDPKESEHDFFVTGHASTSISTALGMAEARDKKGENFKVVAIIGDGAMSGGLAFEGLNNLGYLRTNMTIIINDNKMSISPNVGAMSNHLKLLQKFSDVSTLEKPRRNIKTLFETLGFEYTGPIDGHDIKKLIEAFKKIEKTKKPKVLHILTKKGKGFKPAETTPEKFHGLGTFNQITGEIKKASKINYSKVFGTVLTKLGKKDKKICAITAAMPAGTGLSEFAKEIPDRFYDVGIAEQHAVTFAAGLAKEGFKPVVTLYSTFLQRAFDQILHDVALQNLPVKLFIDRAGLVGDDGPTHHGNFDISFLRIIPRMIIMAPKDEKELVAMVKTSMEYNKGPTAVRYPRGTIVGSSEAIDYDCKKIEIGKAEQLNKGKDISIIAIGNMVQEALEAIKPLEEEGIQADLINARFAKPLDEKTILESAEKTKKVITIEENTLLGGFGSAVSNLIEEKGSKDIEVKKIGVPDRFIEQGPQTTLRENIGLTAENIFYTAKYWTKCCNNIPLTKCDKACAGKTKKGSFCEIMQKVKK